jgi:hypothetical protein
MTCRQQKEISCSALLCTDEWESQRWQAFSVLVFVNVVRGIYVCSIHHEN